MEHVLILFGELVFWIESVTPRGPLLALPVLAAAWLTARRSPRYRATPAAGLVRLWTLMLGLGCTTLLLAWAIASYSNDQTLSWHHSVINALLLVVPVGPAHALRTTLAMALARLPGGDSRLAEAVRGTAWILFSGIVLLCLHAMLMDFAFPFGGGEFHAMFAYTHAGRPEAALAAWRASVLILGLAALVFPAWIPLPWWVHALLASGVGVQHWWMVCTWQPQSAAFHQAVMRLLVAMPVTILLLTGTGAWLRRLWQMHRRRQPVPPSE